MQKNPDARRELLSQLREIYDGEFNKEFGTGASIHWKGNVGFISALTPIGLDLMQQHSTMGERFINYSIQQPPEDELAQMMKKKYRRTASQIENQDIALQEMVAEYVSRKVSEAEAMTEPYPIQDDALDEINEMAIFATRARSPVMLDFKTKEPIDVPIIEGFPRFAMQLQTITKTLMLMQEGSHDITDRHMEIIRKIGLDSIPRKRRLTMQTIASFNSVSTSAFSARIGLPTDTARSWLMELASLGLVVRIPRGGTGNEDAWKMSAYGAQRMKKYEGITPSSKNLLNEDEARELAVPPDQVEEQKEIQVLQIRNQAITAIQEELGEGTSWDEAEVVFLNREAEKNNAEHADMPPMSADEQFEAI